MNKVSHECASTSTSGSAMEGLMNFLAERRKALGAVDNLEAFERELHEVFIQAERDVLAEELARFDVDLPAVQSEGVVYRRVLRCEAEYVSAVGPVRVMRSLYRAGEGERTICPLEWHAGLIEGQWTPLAARQAVFVVAHMTPQEGEDLFRELGNMQPSKSSLDRLPKKLSEVWEAQREVFESTLREEDVVPPEAVAMAASLDGVMVPMKDGKRQAKQAEARAQGKGLGGPKGYQEVACGTLSFFDAEGNRLGTRRFARMPEVKKKTLKTILAQEVTAVLDQRPDLILVKLADGAKDNWTFLHSALPEGVELLDFYHACEHMKEAFDVAYGKGATPANAQFEKYRLILRDDPGGVDKVIRALLHLRTKHPRKKKLATELGYFRKNRHRMQYAEAAAQHLPIGSGLVEAACKTLAVERLRRSGMRWRHSGGQAILTFRALHQSDRFTQAWARLSATYKKTVELPENVVLFPKQKTC
jgi:hypothetical protein